MRAGLVCAFLLSAPAFARDLPRADPERAALLDAARGKQAVKFVVKDLVRAVDLAFLCALLADEKGRLSKTDESVDVYLAFLVKDGGRWLVLDTGGSLSSDASHVDCQPGRMGGAKKTFDTQEQIAAGIREILGAQLAEDLDFGRVDTDKQALFEA
ncbi:MAG TPA: hypothetical protein VN914_21030, partial [Polyangia bacterium]|nr:hypothetical protein [Polyangia bacterium]